MTFLCGTPKVMFSSNWSRLVESYWFWMTLALLNHDRTIPNRARKENALSIIIITMSHCNCKRPFKQEKAKRLVFTKPIKIHYQGKPIKSRICFLMLHRISQLMLSNTCHGNRGWQCLIKTELWTLCHMSRRESGGIWAVQDCGDFLFVWSLEC